MTLSIITFANFGKKKNLKTPDILPVVEVFEREGALGQVICQIADKSTSYRTVHAIPRSLWYSIRVFEKVTRIGLSRQYLEYLFDYFSARRMRDTKFALFHGGYFLPKTIARAKARGAICIDMPVSAHLSLNAALEAEELSLLNLEKHDGWYMQLNRKAGEIEACDYIIALSSFVRDSYLATGFPSERIYVASPDIDLDRFKPLPHGRVSSRPFRFVYTAFTAHLKGLHYLLKAWEALSLEGAELVIVGGYGSVPAQLKLEYDAAISRMQNIVWVGATPAPESWYQDANAFVFPSLSEGFGRVTLEAMACGIPVITTENAQGIVEDGKTGFVVPIRDSDALAEKMRYVYEHQDEALSMGNEARKAVLAKKPFGDAVYEIYQDILKREQI